MSGRRVRRLLLIALVLTGALAWLRGRSAPAEWDGSPAIDPCRESLTWRIGDVDERFGLPAWRVEAAAIAAARLWNDAAGRTALVHDNRDGFPIRLAYDQRQVMATRLRDDRARIDSLGADVEYSADRHRRLAEEYETALAELERRVAALNARIEEYNATVDEWAARGGAPRREARRLEREAEQIDAEQADLERFAGELDQRRREVNLQAQRGSRANQRLRDALERYDRETSGRSVTSGGFAATVEATRNGRVVNVQREIVIYHVEGAQHLTRVLAHEFGHALGIEHVEDGQALMHRRYDIGSGEAPVELKPSDVEALLGLCR